MIDNKFIIDQEKESTNEEKANGKDHLSSERMIEKFFRVYWNQWIAKTKWIVIALVIIWLGIAIWRVSRFEPATEPTEILPSSHYLSKQRDSVRNDYHNGENDNSITVSFLWGIKGLDNSGISKWDASNRGTIIWDDDFDLTTSANQQRIYDICQNLKTNSLVKDSDVTCWIEEWYTYNGNSFPSGATFHTQMSAYLGTNDGENDYTNYEVGYINGTMRFTRIRATSTAEPFRGHKINFPIYDKWEELIESYNTNSPAGVNNAFQTAESHWGFLPTQKEFVDGAIQGTLIAISFAFIVLMISTLNIISAIFATISIACIVMSVIALMEIVGWTLGTIESIAIVILIGFSVDYAVHLANHYVESVFDDRYRRMQDALSGIGISIVSGAITTIGSGIFLFLATVMFFTKFAILITATI